MKYLLILLTFTSLIACKKEVSKPVSFPVLGNWRWYKSEYRAWGNFDVTPQSSGKSSIVHINPDSTIVFEGDYFPALAGTFSYSSRPYPGLHPNNLAEELLIKFPNSSWPIRYDWNFWLDSSPDSLTVYNMDIDDGPTDFFVRIK